MGLIDRIKGEFVDIVEWTDDSRDTIVWRFPRYENEIKMGARLVVRESQVAVFVNQGRLADVFRPGLHTLETANLPLLSTLQGWQHGFHSPFKAEVYFVNTRQFTDMRWGTQNPIMIRDAEFGMVRVRAFGGLSLRVTDPAALLRELVGTDPQFRTAEVADYLRGLIVARLANALATANVPVLDLAGNQDSLGARMAALLTEELATTGVAVPKLIIENISLPPEVEQAVDTRAKMGIVGDLDAFTRFKTAEAIGDAADNPGGAGEGVGLGLGMAMGQRIAGTFAQAPAGPTPAVPAAPPPPLPGYSSPWYVGINGERQGPYRWPDLMGLIDNGTVTRDTLVWHDGMAAWAPAAQAAELADRFPAVPPPLPPQV